MRGQLHDCGLINWQWCLEGNTQEMDPRFLRHSLPGHPLLVHDNIINGPFGRQC